MTLRRKRALRAIVVLSLVVLIVVIIVQVAAVSAGVWQPALLLLFVARLALAPTVAMWVWLARNNDRYRENPLTWTQDD
jgi:hypothetical protein